MNEDRFKELLNDFASVLLRNSYLRRFVSPSGALINSNDRRIGEGAIIRSDLAERIMMLLAPSKTVLVTGGPGSGKTTLWWALTYESTRRTPPLLPVPINLQTLLSASTREEILLNALPSVSSDEFKYLDENHRLLILIDGLNEIDHSKTLDIRAKNVVVSMFRGHERNAVLVTSRSPVPSIFKSNSPIGRPLTEISILPFEEEQIKALIDVYPTVDYKEFNRYLSNGGLQLLAANPQLLSMIIEVFLAQKEPKIPRSIGELFDLFFSAKWNEKAEQVEQPDVGRHTFYLALESLAWHSRLFSLSNVPKHQWSDLLTPFEHIIQRDGLSRQLIIDRSHMLYLMELKTHGLTFVHERFLDYFAARFLKELSWIPEALWYYQDWEQTLSFWASLQNDVLLEHTLEQSRAKGRISLMCKIAAANVGRLKERELQKIFAFLARNLYGSRPDRDQAIIGLAEFPAADSTEWLLQTLPDVPPPDRPAIWWAIGLLREARLTPETYQNLRRRGMRFWKSKGLERQDANLPKSHELRHRDIEVSVVEDVSGIEDEYSSIYLSDAGEKINSGEGNTEIEEPIRGGAVNSRAYSQSKFKKVPQDIEALVFFLTDPSPAVRASTAIELGKLGNRKVISVLIGALRDENPEVRSSVAIALGILGDRGGAESLIASLKDEDPVVRKAAARALGELGDRKAVDSLISILKSEEKNYEVRSSAVKSLGKLGDRKVIDDIIEEMRNPEAVVRREVVRALDKMGDRKSVDVLIVALKDEDSKVRYWAARALGVIGTPKSVDALIAIAKDDAEVAEVRSTAVMSLGILADRAALETLLDTLKSDAPEVRSAAARALTTVGDHKSVDALIAALKDTDPRVREAAASAIGRLGDEKSVNALIVAITDNDSRVRSSIAKALGTLGGSEAIKGLMTLSYDSNPIVRGAALNACLAQTDSQFLDLFLERLEHDSDGINRTIAVKGLGLLGMTDTIEVVTKALNDPNPGVRGEAINTLVKLVPNLDSEGAMDVTSHLTRYWLLSRHTATSQVLFLAIKRLPPPIAKTALDQLNDEAYQTLPAWKLERWKHLKREVELTIRNQAELEKLKAEEGMSLKRVWGLIPKGVSQEVKKTVLELDLVSYSSSAAALEENLGSEAVANLNKQIQSFIDRGLRAVSASWDETVMAVTGDGAILVFSEAEHAHRLAVAVHEITRMHNKGKTEPSAMRLFRMGAATGDIVLQPRPNGGYDIAGITIARAVRLETAAHPGELIVDAKTFEELPPSLSTLYGSEERISGKRTEEFLAYRCTMNPEVPAHLLSLSARVPKEVSGTRRAILDLFQELDPNNLERLIFLLDMPVKEQPPKELSYYERENRILQYFAAIRDGYIKLEAELRYLIERQNTR